MQNERNSPELLAQLLSPKFQDRFWSKINKKGPDECWPWTACLEGGYGNLTIYFNGKPMHWKGHRVAWIIHNKQFPPADNPLILHSCIASPGCCNPAHLKCGTDFQNMLDKVEQGRTNYQRGSKIGTAKLSEPQVAMIKKLLGWGYTSKELGKMFNINKSCIQKISINQTWKHV